MNMLQVFNSKSLFSFFRASIVFLMLVLPTFGLYAQQESNFSFPIVVFERKFSVISMMEDKGFALISSRLLDEQTEILEFERGEGGRKILCRIDLATLLCNTMMVYANIEEMNDHKRWLNKQARPLGNNQWVLPPEYRNLHLIYRTDEVIENDYFIMIFKPYERIQELMDQQRRMGYDDL